MDNIKIKCVGLKVGRVFLPPFSLKEGEILCLHLTDLIQQEEISKIKKTIEGQLIHSNYQLYDCICESGLNKQTNFFSSFIYGLGKKTVKNYLSRKWRIPSKVAKSILNRLNISENMYLKSMPYTLRKLLELEIACSQFNIIITSDGGFDPLGYQQFTKAVVKKLNEKKTFINFFYPKRGGVQECSFQGNCIEILIRD